MTNTIDIMGSEISVKEYNGQRVVTSKDIDAVHRRPSGTARRNYYKNRKRFVEGADYFVRNSYEAKNEFGVTAPNGIILITESGYLMLVKSFDDDLAWEVQRSLVNTYFKVKEFVKAASQNPCAYALAKDRIALWKRKVSNPLIERLVVLTDTEDFVSAYSRVYKAMKKTYGFDMNKARFDFCKRYNEDYENCSVIDCVADNSDLRKAFEECAAKQIRELSEDQLERTERVAERKIREAKVFAAYSEEVIQKAAQAAAAFEIQLENTESDCNCLV